MIVIVIYLSKLNDKMIVVFTFGCIFFSWLKFQVTLANVGIRLSALHLVANPINLLLFFASWPDERLVNLWKSLAIPSGGLIYMTRSPMFIKYQVCIGGLINLKYKVL